MTERMIAICGLVCTACEGYLATQANDQAWKERLAEKARTEYGAKDATADNVTCDGCIAVGKRLSGYCLTCEIRACGLGRGVENCAECAEFETCEKITGFMQMVPEAKAQLTALRRN